MGVNICCRDFDLSCGVEEIFNIVIFVVLLVFSFVIVNILRLVVMVFEYDILIYVEVVFIVFDGYLWMLVYL